MKHIVKTDKCGIKDSYTDNRRRNIGRQPKRHENDSWKEMEMTSSSS